MTQTNTTLNSSVRTSDANTLQYVFDQILFDINTMLPCEIINVNGDRYDVQSLINNLDSVGNHYDCTQSARNTMNNGFGTKIGE